MQDLRFPSAAILAELPTREILDDDQNGVAALRYADFLAAYKAQDGA